MDNEMTNAIEKTRWFEIKNTYNNLRRFLKKKYNFAHK